METIGLLSSAILLIVLDQSAKGVVIRLFRGRPSMHVGAITIRHRLSRQVFSGALKHPGGLLPLLLSVAMLLAVGIQFTPTLHVTLASIAFGLALGGAASNTIDQLLFGGVIDFIDLGWWPVFNLADIAIVLGTVTGLACILF